jgi:hypothetical protein
LAILKPQVVSHPFAVVNRSPTYTHRGGNGGRGGRRPTIDQVVIYRDVHEATGFDKESLNRSMKMNVPTMGPSTAFKH